MEAELWQMLNSDSKYARTLTAQTPVQGRHKNTVCVSLCFDELYFTYLTKLYSPRV